MARVIVKNGPEIMRMLKRLGPAARKTKRRAINAASKPVVDRFRENAPEWSGATKKAVGIRRAKDDSVYIGIRPGPKKVKHPKTGLPLVKNPGQHYAYVVDARDPWFDASWSKIAPQTVGNVERELNKAIQEEFKK